MWVSEFCSSFMNPCFRGFLWFHDFPMIPWHFYGRGSLSTRWAREYLCRTHSCRHTLMMQVLRSTFGRAGDTGHLLTHQYPPQCPLCPCFAHWSLSTLPPTQWGSIIILILSYLSFIKSNFCVSLNCIKCTRSAELCNVWSFPCLTCVILWLLKHQAFVHWEATDLTGGQNRDSFLNHHEVFIPSLACNRLPWEWVKLFSNPGHRCDLVWFNASQNNKVLGDFVVVIV